LYEDSGRQAQVEGAASVQGKRNQTLAHARDLLCENNVFFEISANFCNSQMKKILLGCQDNANQQKMLNPHLTASTSLKAFLWFNLSCVCLKLVIFSPEPLFCLKLVKKFVVGGRWEGWLVVVFL
jgi:hypothetical protein